MNTFGHFSAFIQEKKERKILVVQPRMGFGTPQKMKRGLLATKKARATSVGTITLDSYTRTNDYEAAKNALANGHNLNGYPLVSHSTEISHKVLEGIHDQSFPIQVRHGTALPKEIFKAIVEIGLGATEGGPISYCLPYSRTPLKESIKAWAECCEYFSEKTNALGHLESFAGCMLGQLCPPSLLIALSILEGIFFRKHGIRSLSLSFSQGTHRQQDLAALAVLHQLVKEYLSDLDTHIVMYTYMGIYPQTISGSQAILQESAEIATLGHAHRLIVKTVTEAHRIPSIEENISALELAHITSQQTDLSIKEKKNPEDIASIYEEAKCLIDAVLNLSTQIDDALWLAFQKGYLDVPYCLHADNKNQARSYIDQAGYLQWAAWGKMPFNKKIFQCHIDRKITSDDFLEMLNYNRKKYDNLMEK